MATGASSPAFSSAHSQTRLHRRHDAVLACQHAIAVQASIGASVATHETCTPGCRLPEPSGWSATDGNASGMGDRLRIVQVPSLYRTSARSTRARRRTSVRHLDFETLPLLIFEPRAVRFVILPALRSNPANPSRSYPRPSRASPREDVDLYRSVASRPGRRRRLIPDEAPVRDVGGVKRTTSATRVTAPAGWHRSGRGGHGEDLAVRASMVPRTWFPLGRRRGGFERMRGPRPPHRTKRYTDRGSTHAESSRAR